MNPMKNPPDQFIQVGNIKTRYWDVGQGNVPIVLVHGITASVEYWEKNIFELAKTHRVIAVDLIGFGKTDKPDIDYKIDDFVQFLKSFLDQLNIQNCYLVGHSLGGGICLKFVLDFPNQVKKLVLVSTAGFSHKIPLSMRLTNLPFLDKLMQILITPKMIISTIRQHVYNKSSLSDSFFEKIVPFSQAPDSQRALFNTLRTNINLIGIRSTVFESMKQKLQTLKLPILIIWGKQDKLLPLKNANKIIKLIPHAERYIFDKCGHIPQIEHANKFNQAVQDFL